MTRVIKTAAHFVLALAMLPVALVLYAVACALAWVMGEGS